MLDRVRAARPTSWIAWGIAVAFALWTLVRILGLERGYPGSALIAYTPYVLVLTVPALAAALILRRWRQGGVIGVCLVLLAIAVVPRAIPNGAPDPRPEGPELRVLGQNLMLGEADVDDLAEIVEDRGIDLVALSENTPEVMNLIEQSPLGEELPYVVSDDFIGSRGTGLISRYPLKRLEAPGQRGNDAPTTRALVTLPDGTEAEAYAIHPVPPVSGFDVGNLEDYLEEIPSADPDGPPRLLIGDYNSTLDDERLRDVLDRGYTDAADARGAGLTPTWPTDGFPPPVTIDHILVDDRVEVLGYSTVSLNGTDHRGVEANLRLP